MDDEAPTQLIESDRIQGARTDDELADRDSADRGGAPGGGRPQAIDGGGYPGVAKQKQVRFKHPRFEHLPDREELYQLLEPLDEGGMGEVRIGRDPYLDRRVAVKLLKKEKIASPLNVERFMREAQITAKLDHPNVIPIYALHAENDGRASFAMKLIHGVTLKEIVLQVREAYDAGREPDPELSLRRRIELFLRICDAMEYAHDMGVIHRDLKPPNIMVGEYNEVYVMDWGLAKTIDEPEAEATQTAMWAAQKRQEALDDSVQTQHGALIGTPLYMAPEQAVGRHDLVSYQSDVYSLGCILYELVALRRITPGRSIKEVLQHVVEGNQNAVEPYRDAYKIDRELEAVIRKAACPPIEGRYESVSEFATDLRRYLDDEEVSAHPDSPIRSLQRWMAHRRGLTFALILTLVMLFGGAMIYTLVQQNVATRKQHVRERQLSNLQSLVAERAHTLDRQFLRFELLVNRLAVAAEALMREGTARQGELYTAEEFDTGKGPPDLKPSPIYGKKVSVTHPVFKPAPGVDLEELDSQLRRLLPLKTQFRSIFLDSRLEATPVHSDEELWNEIAVEGVPGRWAFVGLANGVHISYPGKGGYSEDYDPRKRPWYADGLGKASPQWGDPYVDQQGQGLVLPCVVGVISHGVNRGVAGFEVALSFVQKRFMEPMGPATETFVIDRNARVLVTSRGSSLEIDVDDAEDLPRFDNDLVVAEIKSRGAGVLIDRSGNPETVYVVTYMPTLGWYYVARAPMSRVLSTGKAGSEQSAPPTR